MLRPDSIAITGLLTALAAIGSFSTSIYVPSMPALVDAFQTSADRVKLTLSVFLVGFALAQLVYGPLSDRFGRRGTLIVGLVLYVAGDLACALAPSIELMIAGRFLQGVGACAGPALGRAVVRDVHGREGAVRVFAWIGAAMAISPAIGPLLGGHLQVWFGWRASFILLTALRILLLGSVGLLLAETNKAVDPVATHPATMARNYGSLLAHRRFLGFLLCGSLIFAGLYAWIAAGPFLIMTQLGVAPDIYGSLSLFTTGAYLAGSIGAARITPRVGIERMVLIGCALACAGGVSMAIAAASFLSVPGLLGPMLLFAAGMGLTLPNCIAGALVSFPRIAGTASALLGFAQMSVAALATVAMAHLPHYSALALAGTIAGMSLLALAARLVLLRPATS
jgi:DHA1 family bicyclomycin/chloramphenicol resistance-like MFS transporter